MALTIFQLTIGCSCLRQGCFAIWHLGILPLTKASFPDHNSEASEMRLFSRKPIGLLISYFGALMPPCARSYAEDMVIVMLSEKQQR